jgi:FtsP/CotA-like multicopper oxidase with cupredoxin domain
MADMGMAGMDMSAPGAKAEDGMAGMDKPAASPHEGMQMDKPAADPHAGMRMDTPKPTSGMEGMDMGGTPAAPVDGDGIRRLKYDMLRALEPNADRRPPRKEIVARLTGDMTRYFWSINGKKLSQAEPFEIKLGERVRFKLTNETMMEHPMHLHGVFMELVNGNGEYAPRKHTIIVPPAQTVELDATYEDPGVWAFHCHLFYHAATGMFRLVKVSS